MQRLCGLVNEAEKGNMGGRNRMRGKLQSNSNNNVIWYWNCNGMNQFKASVV